MDERMDAPSGGRITDEVRRDIDVCTQNGEMFDTVFIVKSALLCDLDRIDPNGNYEPSNCRWVDAATQNANRRPFKHQNGWTKAKENADAIH